MLDYILKNYLCQRTPLKVQKRLTIFTNAQTSKKDKGIKESHGDSGNKDTPK
jgi:hypothetical protein